jgi:hypothetical protein
MVTPFDRFMEWHLRPLRKILSKRPRKPFSYRDAELRMKELKTFGFLMWWRTSQSSTTQ